MQDPSQSLDAVVQETQAPRSSIPRPTLVWVVSLYSVIWALFSCVSMVMLFANDPIAARLPAYQHLYLYFLPGLHLSAGVTLFFLKKWAFPLYAAYFSCLLAVPVVVSDIFVDPYFSTNWLDIYERTAKSIFGVGWVIAFVAAGYAGYLYRREILK